MAFDRNNMVAVCLAPVQAQEDAKRAEPLDDGCPVPVSQRGDQLLYRLAQSELMHLTGRLTMLCREATEGNGSDRTRLETLRYLSQRLEVAGTVLAELSGEGEPRGKTSPRSLLRLIQEIGRALEPTARERRIVIAIDIAGAVRRPVSAAVSPLLRLMFESAIRATAVAGRVDIVTRREGEVAAVSVTLSAVAAAGDELDGSVLDLAILRNLAVRQGGRLAVVHRHALGQQWVLRLPLGADLSNRAEGLERTGAETIPLRLASRSSQKALLPDKDVQSA